MSREPAFLKLHRTDIAEPRVNAAVVVEEHPVNQLAHGLSGNLELLAEQATHVQAPPNDCPLGSQHQLHPLLFLEPLQLKTQVQF